MSQARQFFYTSAALHADAPSYIEREADTELLDALRRGELCLVLAPRQTGKSSLMAHAIAALRREGIHAGFADLQRLGSQRDPEQWFGAMVNQIKRSLNLETDSAAWWKAHAGLDSSERFANFIEDVLLTKIDGQIVIFFDEIDSVLSLPFSDDFFTTIRSLYNARAVNEKLRRITFVLIGVASPSSFIKERTRTPFNVGHTIELEDFDQGASEPFRKVLGADAAPVIERIFYWTHGQPWLVQMLAKAAHEWPEEERTPERLDQEVHEKYLTKRIDQDTHLKFIQDYLLEDWPRKRSTLKTYDQVLNGAQVTADDSSPVHERLRLAGVVRVEDGKLARRNRIYSNVFDRRWVRAHMPRDTAKVTAWAATSALVVWVLWTTLVRPALAPQFPELERLVRYTADPSVELRLPVSGDIKRATLWRAAAGGEPRRVTELTPAGGVLNTTLGSLAKGTHEYTLTLVGGLLNDTLDLPVEITYYPRWEIRQFPDARLTALDPILQITDASASIRNPLDGRTYGELKGAASVALSSDRRLLAAGYADGRVALGSPIGIDDGYDATVTISEPVSSVAVSTNARLVAAGGDQGRITLWRLRPGKGDQPPLERLRTLAGHGAPVSFLAIADGGGSRPLLLSAAADRTLRLWDPGSGEPLWAGRADHGITAVALAPNGRWLAWATDGGTIRVAGNGGQGRMVIGDPYPVPAPAASLAFSRDGAILAVGRADGVVTYLRIPMASLTRLPPPLGGKVSSVLFDVPQLLEPKVERTLKPRNPGAALTRVGFGANDQLIFAQTPDGELRAWDLGSGAELPLFTGPRGAAVGVAFTPDGERALTTGGDGRLRLWEVDSGALVSNLAGHEGQAMLVAVSPDGKTAASAGRDGAVRLWDLDPYRALRTIEFGPEESPRPDLVGVAFSPDGETVAAGGDEGLVGLWEVATGARRWQTKAHEDVIVQIAFAPDGKAIATAGTDGAVRLLDPGTGKVLETFEVSKAQIYGVAFSPDGALIASGGEDDAIRLWEAATGALQRTLEGHEDNVNLLAFAPDGRTLASASADETAKIWDVQAGQVLRTLSGHRDEVIDVAYSPDGRTLMTSSVDGTVKLWWAAIEPTAARSSQRAGSKAPQQ